MGNLFAEKLELCVSEKVSNGFDKVDTHEMGEAVDMIKDSYEIDMLKSKKKYYDKIIEAMEDSEYGQDYDYEGPMYGYPTRGRGTSMNRSMVQRSSGTRRGNMMGYMPPEMRMDMQDWNRQGVDRYDMMDQMGNMRQLPSQSRYGYSHDEYMNGIKQYSISNPEEATKRKELLSDYMDDLYDMAKDMVNDMSTEEKQLWKAKLNKIINM